MESVLAPAVARTTHPTPPRRTAIRPESHIIAEVELVDLQRKGRSQLGALAFEDSRLLFACLQDGALVRLSESEFKAQRAGPSIGERLRRHLPELTADAAQALTKTFFASLFPFVGQVDDVLGAAIEARSKLGGSSDPPSWFPVVNACRNDPFEHIAERFPGSFFLDYDGIEWAAFDVDPPGARGLWQVVMSYKRNLACFCLTTGRSESFLKLLLQHCPKLFARRRI